MGKSSRKRRQKASLSSSTTKATIPINTGDSNNYYESFPIVRRLSRSRSRSRSRSPGTGQAPEELEGNIKPRLLPSTLSPDKSNDRKSLVDPGNPLGNAVDFCVSNIQTLHTKSINALETTKSIDVTSVLTSCHETSLESVLDEIFLCNKLIRKPNASDPTNRNGTSTVEDTATEGGEDPLETLSQNKKGGKQRWKKKTLMIMPGKKFLRSMSLKRKKSSSPQASTSASTSPSTDPSADPILESKLDDDDVWKGIEDEQNLWIKGATATSCESDEDTLFTNLDDADSWNTTRTENQDEINLPAESQAKITTTDSKRNLFGDEGPSDDDTTFHLFFSPVALCNLSTSLQDGALDPDAIPVKGDLVVPRDFETDAVVDSKHQTVVVPNNSAKTTRPPKISIFGTDSKKSFRKDNEEEAKVEFEMILDDSRFGHRKWGKIIPWKKLGSVLSSSSSHTNSRSNTSIYSRHSRNNRNSRNSSPSLPGSQMSSKKKHIPQDSKAQPKAQEEMDLERTDDKYPEEEESMEPEMVLDGVSRNIIEPRSSPTPSVASTQKSAQVLRKRRLQSALKGFSSSRKNGLKRTSSSISKQRRADWKKMLVVSVPPGQKLQQRREYQEYRSSPKTNPSEISSRQEIGSYFKSPAQLAKEEEETSMGSDQLEYSESDDDEKVRKDTRAKEPETSKTSVVKDQSSTAVMGLHDWSWGVFNMDLKDDEDFDDDDSDIDIDTDIEKEDSNQLILGGVAIPFFGVADGLDHEGDERTEFALQGDACCRNGGHSYAYGEEELSYYDGTKHDDWIMDEDQLVSFEDDSTRKTTDSYLSTNDDSVDTFEDSDNDEINETDINASSLNPKKSSTKSTKLSSSRNRSRKATNYHSVAQMQKGNHPSRGGIVAVQKAVLSRSIFKTFSPLIKKKKKKNGTIDVTSDISVNAESIGSDATDAEDGAGIIEVVLIDPTAKLNHKPIANSITKPVTKPMSKPVVKPISKTKGKNQRGSSSVVVAAAAAAATAAVVSKVAPSTEDHRDDIPDGRSRSRSRSRSNSRSRSFPSNRSFGSATIKKGNLAKKLWGGKPAVQEGKSTASVASMPTSTSSSQRKWSNRISSKSTSRTSSKVSQTSASKDIITVVSKRSFVSEDAAAAAAVATRIRSKRRNDFLDRYTSLVDGDRGKKYDESSMTSSSSDSPSWARDDEDTQSEDLQHYSNRYEFGSPQEVIRE